MKRNIGLIFLFVFLLLFMCDKSKTWTDTLKGVVVRYTGSSNRYSIALDTGGEQIPLILTSGDKYIGSRVRLVVQYEKGIPGFKIVNITVLEWGTSVPSPDKQPEIVHMQDSPEAIQLISKLKRDFVAKKKEMEDLYNSVVEQKVWMENKQKDLNFLDAYTRKAEVQRMKDVRSAVSGEIDKVAVFIDDLKLAWDSEVSAVSWASNSTNRVSITSDIEKTVSNLHREYDSKLASLRNYFSNLELK